MNNFRSPFAESFSASANNHQFRLQQQQIFASASASSSSLNNSIQDVAYFIPVYICALLYCCFGLAIVCDVYFVPALQQLSATYDLPPDIAGSTLMAFGASVPELFASLIGVFVTQDDIGTGSIIGSSCFNLIAVPAACAFVASASLLIEGGGQRSPPVKLSAFPVMRNLSFYVITVLVLILIIEDSIVELSEAIILLSFFVMYIAFMIFSITHKRKLSFLDDKFASKKASTITRDYSVGEPLSLDGSSSSGFPTTGDDDDEHDDDSQSDTDSLSFHNKHYNNQLQLKSQSQIQLSVAAGKMFPKSQNRFSFIDDYNNNTNNSVCLHIQQHQLTEDTPLLSTATSLPIIEHSMRPNVDILPNLHTTGAVIHSLNAKSLTTTDDQRATSSHWFHATWVSILMMPVTLLMACLSPKQFASQRWTLWTFAVSICLIGALTYVSVWSVSSLGKALGLPESIAGMTILSWGTGIPELVASIVLIRKTRQADMAICNTIGSNVIDISFCLSVPWMVKCLMNAAANEEPVVRVQSLALPWSCLTLLCTAVLLIIVLKTYNWELNWRVGVWLLLVYAVFVCCATLLEFYFCETGLSLFDVFGKLSGGSDDDDSNSYKHYFNRLLNATTASFQDVTTNNAVVNRTDKILAVYEPHLVKQVNNESLFNSATQVKNATAIQ